jgi:hypothetical protein
MKKLNYYLIIAVLLLQSCATHSVKYGSDTKKNPETVEADTAKIAHTFYLIGDAGNAHQPNAIKTLGLLEDQLVKSDKNATLLFLGDNIYPNGMPPESKTIERKTAETILLNQLKLSKNFKGKTVFISGNHDWYNGIKGHERQEKFVTDYLKDDKSFLPRKTCAIEDVEINDFVTLITVNSQWFLEDWDNNPTINDNCDIKTREKFLEELESLINKNIDKTIVLALHHPLMSNGSHGGQYSLKKNIYPFQNKIPLPVIGSLINLFRETSGTNPQDIQNKQYILYADRIKNLIKGKENVIVVSGHEHNLQYIEKEKIKQIISGSGSKIEPAKIDNSNDFSYGNYGFASLDVYNTGKSIVSFYGVEKDKPKLLLNKTIIIPKPEVILNFPTTFPATTVSQVYSDDMLNKSFLHNLFLGKHYRKYYGTKVEVKTVLLDTLRGGLTPKKAGGGHQSISLQLEDKDGKEYVMRAMKKSASRFLQTKAFKDKYVEDKFKNTFAEKFLYDFYTTAHPYTPFAVAHMAEKVGVYHSNPVLYYIPKQNALKEYNTEFGGELYMFEERPDKNQKDLASFGKPDDIISTDDLLENIHKDEKYVVDEDSYIRARLFDMLIGDWDRHYDQWRWGEYKKGEKVIYKPIPRDRDQAFSKYDGVLISLLMKIPALRHMQSFKNDIKNIKWFNMEPYPLDIAFLRTASEKDWLTQAKHIQENLSDEDINKAFSNLPIEVRDETIEDLKQKLKSRRSKLENFATDYYKVLQRTVLIVGTNKKDKFVINHLSKNKIEVKVYRLKEEGPEFVYSNVYYGNKTKKIWIFGLDDDDEFEVKGKAKSRTKIRLIGGQNKDAYNIENGRKIKILDFETKENSYSVDYKTKVILTDDYVSNLYDYIKPKYDAFSGLPSMGFNPDDGLKIGVATNYVVNGFNQNPYTQKHSISANYFFATDGFELNYNLEVPKSVGRYNFNFESLFTSPNFAINYFGNGNESINNDDTFGMDYNRVRIRKLTASPQMVKKGRFGSTLNLNATFENIEIEKTSDRFIAVPNIVNNRVFTNQLFGGVAVKYSYENYDNPSFPTNGMGFAIAGSWKINLEEINRNFPSFEAKINFNHKIDPNGKLVVATLLKGKAILNNNFEFYQGATLGGDYDLRGFRNERFVGKQSFYQSSDVRWSIGQINKTIVPLTYGILAGFDYGRVWLDGEISDKWHQSYGGGFWLNGLNIITARITYFKSAIEKARLAFGLGFGF